jgi:nucleoside-triphosphatase THEP1
MELHSTRFRGIIARAVSSPKPLLATIQMRRDPFLDSLKRRADSHLYTLSREIRAETASRVTTDLHDIVGDA